MKLGQLYFATGVVIGAGLMRVTPEQTSWGAAIVAGFIVLIIATIIENCGPD